MEAISFNRIGDKSAFIEAARKIGFDQFAIAEVDVAPQVAKDLLGILIYGWATFHQHLRRVHDEAKKCGSTEFIILKVLTQSTLDLWFSREWRSLDAEQRYGVVYSLLKTSYMHRSLHEYNAIDWGYLERMPNDPWSSAYWQRALERTCIEDGNAPRPEKSDPILLLPEEELAEDEDEFRKEGIYLITLRLVKMFDGGWLAQVCDLSMRAMIVFYRLYDEVAELHRGVPEYYFSSWKSCFVLIAHIQLIALFHMDQSNLSQLNLVLDAMTRQFLVFRRGGATAPVKSASSYIAYLAHRLGLDMKTFTSGYVRYSFRNSYRSPFGEASQVYKAYSLSYHVIYMNRQMHADRDVDTEAYRELFSQYVEERVKADRCVRQEMTRLKRRNRRRKEDSPALKCLAAYMEKLGSGWTRSWRDAVVSEPVFNSLPKREDTLQHALQTVQRHSAVSWNARIIVLVKIISQRYNAVEMWRYHAGLSTDFMVQLEEQLGEYFGELAAACKAHPFLEQELWLTAFYLHPIEPYYKAVVRCGVRNIRRAAGGNDKEPIPKYGLYSSSVVADDIVAMTEYSELQSDYGLLGEVLSRLQMPTDYVKDLLTVTFQTRSKLFMWSYPWKVLRNRCKTLLSKPERKRVYVEQNMSEANDRLPYLNVDYEKYRDRPQLDYGTIELGYEDALLNDDEEEPPPVEYEPKPKAPKRSTKRVSSRYCFVEDDDEEDEEEDVDSGSEADLSMKRSRSRTRNSSKAELEVDDISQEAFVNTVRTRARTAAIRQETLRAKAVTTPKSVPDEENEQKEEKETAVAPVSLDYTNSTEGFGVFTNIWEEPVDPAEPRDHTPLTAMVVRKMLNQYLTLMQTISQRSRARTAAENSSQTEQSTAGDRPKASKSSSSSKKKKKKKKERSQQESRRSRKVPKARETQDTSDQITSTVIPDPGNQVVSAAAQDPCTQFVKPATADRGNQIGSTGNSDPGNQRSGNQVVAERVMSAKTPQPTNQVMSIATPGPSDRVTSVATPDPGNRKALDEAHDQYKKMRGYEMTSKGSLVKAAPPKVARGREKWEQQLDLEPMTSRRALELQKKLGIQLAAFSKRAQKHSAATNIHAAAKRPRRQLPDRTKKYGGKRPAESSSNESEPGRNESQIGRIESESSHVESESGRNESESGRNESESGRNESKSDRNESESGRNESESGRNESKSGRNESESGRNESESSCNKPESSRNESECGRNESESGRNESQSGRNESESGRNESESGRDKSESGRNETESGCNKPESRSNVPEIAPKDKEMPTPSCQVSELQAPLEVMDEKSDRAVEPNKHQDQNKGRNGYIKADTLVGESSESLTTDDPVARGEHRHDEKPGLAVEQVEQQPIPAEYKEPDPESESPAQLEPEQKSESMPEKYQKSDTDSKSNPGRDLKTIPEIEPEREPESDVEWDPQSDPELYPDSEKNENQSPNNLIAPNYSQEDLGRMLTGMQCAVRLRHLTAEDFKDLRQPRVILKRLSLKQLSYNRTREVDSTDRSGNTTPHACTSPPHTSSTTVSASATETKPYVPSPRRTRPKRPRSYAHLYSSSDSSEETTLTALRRRHHCPKGKPSKRHKPPQPAAPTTTTTTMSATTAPAIVRPIVLTAAKSLTVTSSLNGGGGFKLRISSAKDICMERKQAGTFHGAAMQRNADTNEVILTPTPSKLYPVAGRIWKSPVSRTNFGPFIEAPAPDLVSDPLSMEDESVT